MAEMDGACRMRKRTNGLIEKPEVKRHMHRCEGNIKPVTKNIGWNDDDWIHLA
jgi:hypothetical protein